MGANFGQRATNNNSSYYGSNINCRNLLATKSHTDSSGLPEQRATNNNGSYYASNTNFRDLLATKSHIDSSGQRATNSNGSYYASNTNHYRDPLATKMHTDSDLPASSKSRKKRSSRCRTLSEPTKQRYGQLEPLNGSPLHCQRGTYPGYENIFSFSRETRHYSQNGCGTDSLSMQGERLFTRGRLTNAATGHNFKVSTKSKIQELILQCPTDYSQSRPALRLMLGACGSKDVKKLTAEDPGYEWSEIFRVARRVSRSVSHVSPEITSAVPRTCYGVLYEVTQPASRRVLKLPQMYAERVKVESDGTSETINLLPGLQFREVFGDTDSENTGLVIELPEIASDIVRIAQK